jgi:hypothetical protein
MPKVFYTEIDIEDMVRHGVLSLEINDNVVLTDLAYEKANRLGLKLVRDKPENPPAAPVRPYISQQAFQRPPEAAPRPSAQPAEGAASAARPGDSDLQGRIRSAVIARMGNQVDAALLDAIIQRVLASTGVK